MKLRHLLLGSVAALAAAGSANAATGWYMSLGAGANWLPDSDVSFFTGKRATTEYETGYAVAGALGYDWGRWRAEFEVAYRDNNVDCISGNYFGAGCVDPGSNNGIWELSQMVNVLYDFDLSGRFSASVGAGVGGVLVVASQAIGIPGGGNFSPDLDDYVLAGQLIGEGAYDLTDRWQVYADYRYMLADDPESVVNSSGFGSTSWEKSDHSVMVGFRFDLQRDTPPPAPPVAPPSRPFLSTGTASSSAVLCPTQPWRPITSNSLEFSTANRARRLQPCWSGPRTGPRKEGPL